MKYWRLSGLILSLLISLIALSACESTQDPNELTTDNTSAAVTAVSITGDPGNYTFSVTIESPDVGCDQYADWWEVLTNDGRLIYRRILAHSHVDEQPFTRSGGPVDIAADQTIIVRAHMNDTGYAEQVFEGSVEIGLVMTNLDSLFATELEVADPLPTTCAF